MLDVSLFAPGEKVTVRAVGKGKGFAGVVKRHGFAGGPGSHGSDFHRAPGAIGGRWPQRVPKGRRMAGRMGGKFVTMAGLEIMVVDRGQNLMAVKGAVPGPRRALLAVHARTEAV
jgi:large subunit ribosomal protein L3